METKLNLKGKKFGRWLVLEYKGKNKWHQYQWLCKCECGTERIVREDCLVKNKTLSCGCLAIEKSRKRIKHGLYNTKLYRIWSGLKRRCYNEKSDKFKNYGGRGITVCNEWQKDFINFYNWAINNGYKDGLTIDRIDVNGNYEPKNCRFITNLEQQSNKRNNVKITYNGKTKVLNRWAKKYNTTSTILKRYIDKYGIEKCFMKLQQKEVKEKK